MQLDLFDDKNKPDIEECTEGTGLVTQRKQNLSYSSKVCSDCGEDKNLTEYPKHRFTRDGRFKRCRDCYNEKTNTRYALKKTSRPAPEDRICECCGVEVKYETMHFDECHETKTFRGWLCRSCNQGIGMLGDNITGVERALAYLKRHYHGSTET